MSSGRRGGDWSSLHFRFGDPEDFGATELLAIRLKETLSGETAIVHFDFILGGLLGFKQAPFGLFGLFNVSQASTDDTLVNIEPTRL